MKRRNSPGFTLIELIIVIAIITILAAIVVVTINPAAIFANSRNSNRANDMTTIQSALQRFLAESPATSAARTLYGTAGSTVAFVNGGVPGTPTSAGLVSGPGAGSNGAYAATPNGACAGGAAGTGLATAATTAFTLIATGASGTNVDLSNLVTLGYLTKIPVDPLTGGYKVCIDTTTPSSPNSNTSPGKLVIFANQVENGGTIPYVVI